MFKYLCAHTISMENVLSERTGWYCKKCNLEVGIFHNDKHKLIEVKVITIEHKPKKVKK